MWLSKRVKISRQDTGNTVWNHFSHNYWFTWKCSQKDESPWMTIQNFTVGLRASLWQQALLVTDASQKSSWTESLVKFYSFGRYQISVNRVPVLSFFNETKEASQNVTKIFCFELEMNWQIVEQSANNEANYYLPFLCIWHHCQSCRTYLQ